VYVQHAIDAQTQLLWDLIDRRHCSIYLSGYINCGLLFASNEHSRLDIEMLINSQQL
jgi:hypothetical protein